LGQINVTLFEKCHNKQFFY